MNTINFQRNRFKMISDALKDSNDMISLKSIAFENDVPALPEEVKTWLRGLKNLDGVPYNYIVPDERMLPKESIRFFYVDQGWLTCLLEGAASVGRAVSSDLAHDKAFQEEIYSELDLESPITGFLLRSYVVKGWPDMGLIAYDKDKKIINPRKLTLVAPDVLLGMFDGKLEQISFHEAFEVIHFGFNPSGEKELKYINEADGGNKPGEIIGEKSTLDVSSYMDSDTRVVKINEMVKAMKDSLKDYYQGAFTSAEFALEMTQGVQQVSFNIAKEDGGDGK